MRLSKKKVKKSDESTSHALTAERSESTDSWNSSRENLNTLQAKHTPTFFSTEMITVFHFFICWFVELFMLCPIVLEQIQHDRTSLYMILSFQNDSVHKNINPNKGAAEYFGDFSV